MKEVVVILSVIFSGHIAVAGLPFLAGFCSQIARTTLLEEGYDSRFVGFDSADPISKEDLLRYNEIYSVPIHQNVGHSAEFERRIQTLPLTINAAYSHPSSLMSATSNPSERSASPAIF